MTSDEEQRLLELLGLTHGASADDVKRARKRLSRLYHTDRLGHESDEVRAHADRMMTQVNVACDALLKAIVDGATADAERHAAEARETRRREDEAHRRHAAEQLRRRAAKAEAERRAAEADARAAHDRAAKMVADELRRVQLARRRRRRRIGAIVGGSLALAVIAGLVVHIVDARRAELAGAVSFCCPHHVATSVNDRYLIDQTSRTVVDTSSDRVVAETEYNPHHLALSALTPDGHTGYALYTPAAYGTSTSAITVFDVDKGTVRRTLPLAGAGRMLALSPETGVICVASIDGPVLAVQIVDSGSGIVLGTATAVGADTILDIAVAPHTSTAYVLSTSGPVGTVSVFDVEERSAVGQINVGRLPTGIVFAPDGRHAYVVNEGSGTISVIDTATRTLAVDIPVGMDPLGAAVGPDAAYVIRKNSRDIGVIDLGTYRVVRTVSLDRYPVGVGYSAASRRLYVFTATGEVQVLDPVSLRPAGSPAAPAV